MKIFGVVLALPIVIGIGVAIVIILACVIILWINMCRSNGICCFAHLRSDSKTSGEQSELDELEEGGPIPTHERVTTMSIGGAGGLSSPHDESDGISPLPAPTSDETGGNTPDRDTNEFAGGAASNENEKDLSESSDNNEDEDDEDGPPRKKSTKKSSSKKKPSKNEPNKSTKRGKGKGTTTTGTGTKKKKKKKKNRTPMGRRTEAAQAKAAAAAKKKKQKRGKRKKDPDEDSSESDEDDENGKGRKVHVVISPKRGGGSKNQGGSQKKKRRGGTKSKEMKVKIKFNREVNGNDEPSPRKEESDEDEDEENPDEIVYSEPTGDGDDKATGDANENEPSQSKTFSSSRSSNEQSFHMDRDLAVGGLADFLNQASGDEAELHFEKTGSDGNNAGSPDGQGGSDDGADYETNDGISSIRKREAPQVDVRSISVNDKFREGRVMKARWNDKNVVVKLLSNSEFERYAQRVNSGEAEMGELAFALPNGLDSLKGGGMDDAKMNGYDDGNESMDSSDGSFENAQDHVESVAIQSIRSELHRLSRIAGHRNVVTVLAFVNRPLIVINQFLSAGSVKDWLYGDKSMSAALSDDGNESLWETEEIGSTRGTPRSRRGRSKRGSQTPRNRGRSRGSSSKRGSLRTNLTGGSDVDLLDDTASEMPARRSSSRKGGRSRTPKGSDDSRLVGASSRRGKSMDARSARPSSKKKGKAKKKRIRKKDVSMKEKIWIAMKIGKGLMHLHKNGVIHKNLSLSNVYLGKLTKRGRKVTEKSVIKIGNHGGLNENICGYITDQSGGVSDAIHLDLKWMAPESIEKREFDQKTDVYGYGITLYELIYECPPFDGMGLSNAMEIALKVCTNGLRPEMTEYVRGKEIDERIIDVIERMWDDDPRMRPTIPWILKQLESVYSDL